MYTLLFRILDWKYFSLKIAQLSLASLILKIQLDLKKNFLYRFFFLSLDSNSSKYYSIIPLTYWIEKICSALQLHYSYPTIRKWIKRACIFSITLYTDKLLFSSDFPSSASSAVYGSCSCSIYFPALYIVIFKILSILRAWNAISLFFVCLLKKLDFIHWQKTIRKGWIKTIYIVISTCNFKKIWYYMLKAFPILK